jgi:hypothetical protein
MFLAIFTKPLQGSLFRTCRVVHAPWSCARWHPCHGPHVANREACWKSASWISFGYPCSKLATLADQDGSRSCMNHYGLFWSHVHPFIKQMPFTHSTPNPVWSTPTWSCDEANLQQVVQWEGPWHAHKRHWVLVLSAELEVKKKSNVLCHDSLAVTGKASEVVDVQEC